MAADGAEAFPRIEDLVRLGKSDWNFFSNWDYGVPEEAVEPYCAVDVEPADHVDRRPGGDRRAAMAHRIDLLGVEVASCYVSDAPGARRLVRNTWSPARCRAGLRLS